MNCRAAMWLKVRSTITGLGARRPLEAIAQRDRRLPPRPAALFTIAAAGVAVLLAAGAGAQPANVPVGTDGPALLQIADAAADLAKQRFAEAYALLQHGDIKGAEKGFEDGLELDPNSALGHYYLGETYRAMLAAPPEPAVLHDEQTEDSMFYEYTEAARLGPTTEAGQKAAVLVSRERLKESGDFGGRWYHDDSLAAGQETSEDDAIPYDWLELHFSDSGDLKSMTFSHERNVSERSYAVSRWKYNAFFGMTDSEDFFAFTIKEVLWLPGSPVGGQPESDPRLVIDENNVSGGIDLPKFIFRRCQ